MKIIKYYVCEYCGEKIRAEGKDLPLGWMLVRDKNFEWTVLCPLGRGPKNTSTYSTSTTNYYSAFPQPLKDKGARKTKNDPVEEE